MGSNWPRRLGCNESTAGGLSLCGGGCVGLRVDVEEEAGVAVLRGCGLRVLADDCCGALVVGGVKNEGAGSVSYIGCNVEVMLSGLGCIGGGNAVGRKGWSIWDRNSDESV